MLMKNQKGCEGCNVQFTCSLCHILPDCPCKICQDKLSCSAECEEYHIFEELCMDIMLKEDNIIWITGEFIYETSRGAVWSIAGVFDKEKDAVKACINNYYFVGPVKRNVKLPEKNKAWPGCYYPIS